MNHGRSLLGGEERQFIIAQSPAPLSMRRRVRDMAWKHKPGHKATLDLIKSCAANGVGIDALPDAGVHFRFVPKDQMLNWKGEPEHPPRFKDSFTPNTDAARGGYEGNHGPSSRGSVRCGKGKPKHIKNWSPARTSLDPMYAYAMKGDSEALTAARAAWSMGNPKPLRQWLADQAEHRRLCQQREKESVAA